MKIPIFPGKYHQNGGFSMAMLVYRRVKLKVEMGCSFDSGSFTIYFFFNIGGKR